MTLTIRKRKMIYKLKRWNVLCIILTSQLTTRVPELYENLSPTQKLKLNFPIRTILMQFHLKTNQTKPKRPKRFMARFHSHHFSTKSSTFSGHFYPKKSHTKCACRCQMSQGWHFHPTSLKMFGRNLWVVTTNVENCLFLKFPGIPSENKQMSPWKIVGLEDKPFLLKWPVFWAHVDFRGGVHPASNEHNWSDLACYGQTEKDLPSNSSELC